MAVKDGDEISKIATARFAELMRDMGWTEDWAVAQLYEEIGQPLGITEKAVKQWFDPERGIPVAHVFNISTVFGIDAGWLVGQPHIEKSKAVRSGLYAREVEREKSRSTPAKRSR